MLAGEQEAVDVESEKGDYAPHNCALTIVRRYWQRSSRC
jgi:hypothetical protein